MKIPTLASLSGILVVLAASTAHCQLLAPGITREEVMKAVYRDGVRADTVRQGSHLMNQIRTYPDTGIQMRYAEAIRVAPVTMLGIDGYAAFIFDSSDRLHSYRWM